jgi:hypothetical protein
VRGRDVHPRTLHDLLQPRLSHVEVELFTFNAFGMQELMHAGLNPKRHAGDMRHGHQDQLTAGALREAVHALRREGGPADLRSNRTCVPKPSQSIDQYL